MVNELELSFTSVGWWEDVGLNCRPGANLPRDARHTEDTAGKCTLFIIRLRKPLTKAELGELGFHGGTRGHLPFRLETI